MSPGHESLPEVAGAGVLFARVVRVAVSGWANPPPLLPVRLVRVTLAVLKPVGLRWRCLWWKSLWSACFRQSESAERFPINVHDS